LGRNDAEAVRDDFSDLVFSAIREVEVLFGDVRGWLTHFSDQPVRSDRDVVEVTPELVLTWSADAVFAGISAVDDALTPPEDLVVTVGAAVVLPQAMTLYVAPQLLWDA
jgi:hypothetical protein